MYYHPNLLAYAFEMRPCRASPPARSVRYNSSPGGEESVLTGLFMQTHSRTASPSMARYVGNGLPVTPGAPQSHGLRLGLVGTGEGGDGGATCLRGRGPECVPMRTAGEQQGAKGEDRWHVGEAPAHARLLATRAATRRRADRRLPVDVQAEDPVGFGYGECGGSGWRWKPGLPPPLGGRLPPPVDPQAPGRPSGRYHRGAAS